jgi:putative membrane protein
MMGWYHDGFGWGGWLVMTAAMVLFWGLVIWGMVAIFRVTTDPPKPTHGDTAAGAGRPDPMEILDERFARGEIDDEEYHARQGVLRARAR